ncbi:MAG: hypothetical protein ACRD2M_00570 [Terriglobales bacterium]
MSVIIDTTGSVQVSGGPILPVVNTFTVDAYDLVEVAIEAAAKDIEVQIQPGGSGQVQLLVITADRYDKKLTYKVNSKTSTDIVMLDAPQIFLGTGAVELLSAAPTKLFFSNDLAEDASIKILVGRDATP